MKHHPEGPTRFANAIVLASVALALCTAPPLLGQETQRAVEVHPFDDPEGHLMGFYSASVIFTPIGMDVPQRPWRLGLGVEVSYIPELSQEQRTAGRDKPEATNLAPVFARPRLMLSLPGKLLLELGWVPPFKVYDITANVGNVALSAPFRVGEVDLVPRVNYSWGEIKAPITCNQDLATSGNQSFEVYYALVCHDRESDDHFKPNQFGFELDGRWSTLNGQLAPYGGIGVERYNTTFDIGVLQPDGSRDTDHPILELHATRPYGMVGVLWNALHPVGLSAELFYAPGSLLTMRVMGRVAVNGQ